jgi:hypothetical protein
MSKVYLELQIYRIYEDALEEAGVSLDKLLDAKTRKPIEDKVLIEIDRFLNKEGCYK